LPRFGLDLPASAMQNSDLSWDKIQVNKNWVTPWEQSNSSILTKKILQLPAQVILPANHFIS